MESETLGLKKLYQLQKTGYLRILIFGLKLNISGTSAYNFIVLLFIEKRADEHG